MAVFTTLKKAHNRLNNAVVSCICWIEWSESIDDSAAVNSRARYERRGHGSIVLHGVTGDQMTQAVSYILDGRSGDARQNSAPEKLQQICVLLCAAHLEWRGYHK